MRGRILAVLVTGLLFAGAASAEEWPASLRLGVGTMMAADPVRAAPALDLRASVGPQSWPVRLVAGLNGWTLPGRGDAAGNELALSVGIGLRRTLSRDLSLSFEAAPAMLLHDRATSATEVSPGLLLSPSLELGSRRRTLAFSVGLQGLVTSAGVRAGANAGVIYSFR